MEEETENSLDSTLATPPANGSGLVNEARVLFDQLAGEVAHQAKQDQAEARARGPIAKTLLAACVVSGVLAVVTLLYGAFRFPDAPIREARSGYVGKTGTPHTQPDYEQFLLWEQSVGATFALAFLAGFSGVAADGLNRRRRDSTG